MRLNCRFAARQFERHDALSQIAASAQELAAIAQDAQRSVSTGRGQPRLLDREVSEMLELLDSLVANVNLLQTQRGRLDWVHNY